MKNLILKNRLALLGIVVGGLTGLGYWYFVGCDSGSCPITSRPVNSILYFSAMGGLFFSIFKRNNNNVS